MELQPFLESWNPRSTNQIAESPLQIELRRNARQFALGSARLLLLRSVSNRFPQNPDVRTGRVPPTTPCRSAGTPNIHRPAPLIGTPSPERAVRSPPDGSIAFVWRESAESFLSALSYCALFHCVAGEWGLYNSPHPSSMRSGSVMNAPLYVTPPMMLPTPEPSTPAREIADLLRQMVSLQQEQIGLIKTQIAGQDNGAKWR